MVSVGKGRKGKEQGERKSKRKVEKDDPGK